MGSLAYLLTEAARRKVRAVAVGVPQDQIALSLRIDAKTLRKQFREDPGLAAADPHGVAPGLLQ